MHLILLGLYVDLFYLFIWIRNVKSPQNIRHHALQSNFFFSLSFWFIFPHTLASKKKQKPFKSRKQLRSQVCSGIHLVVWWNKHTLSQKYLPLKKSNRSTAVYCAVLLPCVETDGTNKDKHNTCISVVVFTVAQDFNSDQGLLMVKC